jgi:multiple sugar transport system substrate-binding protein
MRALSALAVLGILAPTVAACGGGGTPGATSAETLTYWASNQGTTVEDDRRVLRESLDRFTDETGIEVELEVIPWSDLYNRILTAVSSGEGPDILNIGNTWATTLQETGAFVPFEGESLEAVGGQERFVQSSWLTGGGEGTVPTSIPLYGLSYSLYYNTEMFKAAGIEAPPETWEEFVSVAKKLTKDTDGDGKTDQWGVSLAGSSISNNAHQAFVRGLQAGGSLFDEEGNPTFDSESQVQGVKQWVDLMATHKVVDPSNAEYSAGSQMVDDFAAEKSAMFFDQAPGKTLEARGFENYAAAPVPLTDAGATGDEATMSHVAGINLSIFGESDNTDGALKLAAHLTSTAEQIYLNRSFTALPVVTDAYADEAFQSKEISLKQKILENNAKPMPLISAEGQMETLVGTAIKNLFAQAATGTVSEADIRQALKDANSQMVAAQ